MTSYTSSGLAKPTLRGAARWSWRWALAFGLASAGPLSGCGPDHELLIARIDASLASAGRFLVKRQSADGAWRSTTYGCFRDDAALTPFVLSSLFFLPETGESTRASVERGRAYLAAMVDADGKIAADPWRLSFPVYTAAAACWVATLDGGTTPNRRVQAAWLDYLRRYRLGQANGWNPSDAGFGGWGYSPVVPIKNVAAGPGGGHEANLSATIFALGALRAAGVEPGDAVIAEALEFVNGCQNYADDPAARDSQFDDGGFFFSPVDAARNKAGLAGTDRFGRQRFRSYGSTTADGLRALICCGLPADHPRVVAARRWLERHFSIQTNPGRFAPDRAVLQGATYYYYCWTLTHALMVLNVRELDTPGGRVRWAEALAQELIQQQHLDGSWSNHFTDTKEDDPLVATPFAAAALAICRRSITGDSRRAPSSSDRINAREHRPEAPRR